MIAKTFHGESLVEIESKINHLLEGEFNPGLAILFSSPAVDFMAVSEIFQKLGIEVMGSTTAGEIADDIVLEFAVAGMLLDIDSSTYSIAQSSSKGKNTYQSSLELAQIAKETFKNPSMIVLSGGLTTDGEEIIRGVRDVMQKEIPLAGGLAGDDFNMEASYVFHNDWKTDEGLVTLILDSDRIEMKNLAASGWQPVGVEKTITKSEGNVVYTIDNEPAIDVFAKYFGLAKEGMDVRKDVAKILGAQYPLQVIRDRGQSIIRTPLIGNSEDGSLIFAGGIPQGARVKFSISPGFDIIENALGEFQGLNQHNPQADALILFSCKARHLALGPMVKDEISGMQKMWKAPLLGFFTYGEIGSLDGDQCDFHNETCSLVVLKEK